MWQAEGRGERLGMHTHVGSATGMLDCSVK